MKLILYVCVNGTICIYSKLKMLLKEGCEVKCGVDT